MAYARREQVIIDDRSRSIFGSLFTNNICSSIPSKRFTTSSWVHNTRFGPRACAWSDLGLRRVGVGRCRVVLTARTRGGRSDFFRHRGFLPSVAFLPFPIEESFFLVVDKSIDTISTDDLPAPVSHLDKCCQEKAEAFPDVIFEFADCLPPVASVVF